MTAIRARPYLGPTASARLGSPGWPLRVVVGLALALGVTSLFHASPASCTEVVSPPIQLSTFAGIENEPGVAGQGDDVVAVWYQQVFRDEVGWAYSRDAGLTWTLGPGLPLRSGRDQIRGRPIVATDGSGNFYCAVRYQDGVEIGDALAVYRGSFEGQSFVWQAPAYALPSVYESDPYQTPHLVCDHNNGLVYLTCTRIGVITYGNEQHTIVVTRSEDHGITWNQPLALSSTASEGSMPAVGPGGELCVAWQDFATSQVLMRMSVDHGVSFGPSLVVGTSYANLGVSPPGWATNYAPFNAFYRDFLWGGSTGYPELAIDGSGGPRHGTVYVAWAEGAQGVVSSPTLYVNEVEPNDYYANATPLAIGESVYGYEGSADFEGGDCDFYRFEGVAGTHLWVEGGVSFYDPIYPEERMVYTLECGEDTLALVHVTGSGIHESRALPPLVFTIPASGRYYLRIQCAQSASIWYRLDLRELTPGGAAAQDHRDIVLVSSSDGGATWSPKVRVNDDPPMFDNAFPALAVDGAGRVHVSWYDRREEPACGAKVHTYWTYSEDGGHSFHPSQRLSVAASTATTPGPGDKTSPGWRVGDHAALVAVGERAYALWTQVEGLVDDYYYAADVYAVVIQPDVQTGVVVAGFAAAAVGNAVEVSWYMGGAAEVTAFRVERATSAAGPYTTVAEPLPRSDGSYQVRDEGVAPGGTYYYRLEVVLRDGTRSLQGPVVVRLGGLAGRLHWQSSAPNPFRERVQLELACPRAGLGVVSVYDVSGHEVRRLHAGTLGAGANSLIWDGTNGSGRAVRPGVYLVRAVVETETAVQRVVRM